MAIDVFGNDSGVNQQNNLTQENVSLREEAQDWNNKIQTQYNQDKSGETLKDDATYTKDLVGNVMGSMGLNQAYSGRKEQLVQDARDRLEKITPKSVEPVAPTEVRSLGRTALSGDLGTIRGEGVPSTSWMTTPPPPNPAASARNTTNPIGEGEPSPAYRNGGTAEEESSLKATIGKAPKQEDTLLGGALDRFSGGVVGEGAAKTIGRVGGAVTSAAVGGLDLYQGIENLDKHQNFFGKDHDWEDVVSKTSQMIAGGADMAGLIPVVGPEIAAIGNVIGLVGGVVGMFGDHKKNLQNDQNVEDEKNQLKNLPASRVADQVASVATSTLQAQTS